MTLEEHIEATLRRVLDEKLRPLEDAVRRLRAANDDELLTVEAAAELTGYKVRTLRARAKAGTVPAFKPPGSSEWRFRRAELLAWSARAPLDTETEARKIAANLTGR